jgi:hypothetical protein
MFTSDALPKLSVRLPRPVKSRLASVATYQGLTMNSVVIIAVQAYLAGWTPLPKIEAQEELKAGVQPLQEDAKRQSLCRPDPTAMPVKLYTDETLFTDEEAAAKLGMSSLKTLSTRTKAQVGRTLRRDMYEPGLSVEEE